MIEPIIKSEIKIEYINEFGDKTEFVSTLPGMCGVHQMQEVFCRFLLAAGWHWDSVKEYHPDYIDEK